MPARLAAMPYILFTISHYFEAFAASQFTSAAKITRPVSPDIAAESPLLRAVSMILAMVMNERDGAAAMMHEASQQFHRGSMIFLLRWFLCLRERYFIAGRSRCWWSERPRHALRVKYTSLVGLSPRGRANIIDDSGMFDIDDIGRPRRFLISLHIRASSSRCYFAAKEVVTYDFTNYTAILLSHDAGAAPAADDTTEGQAFHIDLIMSIQYRFVGDKYSVSQRVVRYFTWLNLKPQQ